MSQQTLDFYKNSLAEKPVNVSSVPQRSPFRYPGGKTWLIPVIRRWLVHHHPVQELIEPFAGGGIVSLTAAFEDLAEHITMIELDGEVAAVWSVILNGSAGWLAEKITDFNLTQENVNEELKRENKTTKEIAFCTILKNRVFHGGIITKGSGMLKHGENGKGILSRWYPETLRKRIINIDSIKHKIGFECCDAFEVIGKNLSNANACLFIDPPYTVAGKRLYTHFEIDHENLFELTSRLSGKFMLTYDDSEEIRNLADKYKLQYRAIPMKTTHHREKFELIISDSFDWLG